MNITIHREGKNYGPYSIEVTERYIEEGIFLETDFACYDGNSEWRPLSSVVAELKLSDKLVATHLMPKEIEAVKLAPQMENKVMEGASIHQFKEKRLSRQFKIIAVALVAFLAGVGSTTALFMVIPTFTKLNKFTNNGPADADIEACAKEKLSTFNYGVILTKTTITRGDSYLSKSDPQIISGTPIYPIKIEITYSGIPAPATQESSRVTKEDTQIMNFFKDPFGEWKYSNVR